MSGARFAIDIVITTSRETGCIVASDEAHGSNDAASRLATELRFTSSVSTTTGAGHRCIAHHHDDDDDVMMS